MTDWRQDLRTSLKPHDLKGAAFLGLIVGLGTFWNGALMIAALLILGSAIVWSRHRTDLIVACAIATTLSLIEARLFITSGKSVAPHFQFGFVAEIPSVRGLVVYFLTLLGLLVPVLAMAMVLLKPRGRWFLASLLVPLAFASTFAFTPDVAVNHKFVNASVRIASLFAAMLMVWLLDEGRIARATAVVLIVCLTITGVVDFISLWNFNLEKRTHNLADPLLEWAHRKTSPHAVFASAPIYHNIAYLTGRKSYLGLPYWVSSTGYDVEPRMNVLKRIYEGGNPAEIRKTALEAGIDYMIVDDSVRRYFPATNETAISKALPMVFSSGTTHVYGVYPDASAEGAVPNPVR
jgi:hypothetical protein